MKILGEDFTEKEMLVMLYAAVAKMAYKNTGIKDLGEIANGKVSQLQYEACVVNLYRHLEGLKTSIHHGRENNTIDLVLGMYKKMEEGGETICKYMRLF